MSKISAYGPITAPQSNDLLITVDVNDTSMAPTGTDKKMTLGQLYGNTAPWQFTPEAYGAKGNGKVVSDVTSNGTGTFSSPTVSADASAPGKYIMIHGANGTAGGPVIDTIASVNPGGGTFTLTSHTASNSVSNCPSVYGTDDVTAINSALAAAGTYATSNSYFAEVVFGAKIYILGTGPTQTTSPIEQNAQLTLPYPNVNGTTQKMIIALTGAGDAGYCQYWESLVPNVAGTALVSMTTAPSTPSGTYGNQSVIGGPSAGGAFTGGYANVKAVVKGISVWCPIWTNQYAFDFGYVSAMRVQQSSAHIFAPAGVNGSAIAPYLQTISSGSFTGSIGTGFRTPVVANNDDIVMDDVTAEGYECGFRVCDHFNAGRIAAIYSDVAMLVNLAGGASGVSHGVFVQSMSAEVYNGGLSCNGGGGTTCQIDINWDAECSGVTYDLSDSGDVLYGLFRFKDPADARFPTVSNATNVKVICDQLGPGYWSGAPSVPGSTTPQQNTAWRDATIYLTSGGAAVTVIAVDGHATGLTLGTSGAVTVRVPAGKNITLTYASTAPTWVWVLD